MKKKNTAARIVACVMAALMLFSVFTVVIQFIIM